MDTTKKYIEMCEKAAKEDLPSVYDKMELLDFIAMEQTVRKRDFEVMSGLQVWHRLAPLTPIDSNRLLIKLFRQEQLQKMVINKSIKHNIWALHCAFHIWGGSYPGSPQKFVNGLSFTSMEQLWLAFVMQQKYNKMWDGKDWINA